VEAAERVKAQYPDAGMRSQGEVLAAEQEFFDRVWYERHLSFRQRYEAGADEGTPEDVYRLAWFVDCKHYERGVPPEALQGLLTWAQAERPHVALVMASGFLSNAAKDYLRVY
jgi:RimJ/RimL family protein N-acetyltransferase